MSDALRIGELAQAAGVTSDTIRYYERLRLLPRPARSGAGYRIYAATDIERLQFIKQAQTLGLSLEEIRALLPRGEAGLAECQRVRDLLSAKLGELDTRLTELRAFRRRLARYLRECEETLAGNRGDCCPVLFEITHARDRKTKPRVALARRVKQEQNA